MLNNRMRVFSMMYCTFNCNGNISKNCHRSTCMIILWPVNVYIILHLKPELNSNSDPINDFFLKN